MNGNAFSGGINAAQRVLSGSSVLRTNVMFSYGVGLAAFIPALALRFALEIAIPNFPYITFIPAVIISAFLAGSRAGVLCAVLSFLSAWYWFVDPMVPFSTSFTAVVGLGLFAFIVAVDIAIIEIASKVVDRLTTQEAQLNTIVETVPVGLLMADFPSGKIMGGNKYIEQMLRHPVFYSADFQSYGEWVSFHEDGSRVEADEYPLAAIMLRGEENPSLDVHYQRGDGSKAWIRIVARPVRDNGGKITGGVAAVIDIDEQYKTRIALEEALRDKEVLLYEVNHRVKNSLQLVSSILLLEGAKIHNSEARSSIMVARDKVDLVARLHQLLYANGAHDRVDLKIALEDVVRHLILSAGRDDVTLEFDFSGDLMVDIQKASPLVLAVNEIVTNALKYGLGSEQPKLTVTANNIGDEMTLVIRDNGPGIAVTTPDDKPGMGSEIIKGLVSQMRGTLVLESNGSGTANILTVQLDPHSSDRKGTS